MRVIVKRPAGALSEGILLGLLPTRCNYLLLVLSLNVSLSYYAISVQVFTAVASVRQFTAVVSHIVAMDVAMSDLPVNFSGRPHTSLVLLQDQRSFVLLFTKVCLVRLATRENDILMKVFTFSIMRRPSNNWQKKHISTFHMFVCIYTSTRHVYLCRQYDMVQQYNSQYTFVVQSIHVIYNIHTCMTYKVLIPYYNAFSLLCFFFNFSSASFI